MGTRSPLTKRQDNFIAAYCKSGNATQAAITAGYSPRSARVTGSRLLTNIDIQQRLRAAGQLGLDTLESIAQNGINELARVSAARTLIEYSFSKPERASSAPQSVNIILNSMGSKTKNQKIAS